MAKKIEGITTNLALDSKQFDKGLDDAKKKAKKDGKAIADDLTKEGFGSQLMSTFNVASLSAVAAIAMIANQVRSIVNQTIEAQNRLRQTSIQSALPTATLQVAEFLETASGFSQGSLTDSFTRFNEVIGAAGIGNAQYLRSLDRIGLTYNQLAGLRPEQQMQSVVRALNSIGDAATRHRIGIELFGQNFPLIAEAMSNELPRDISSIDEDALQRYNRANAELQRRYNELSIALSNTLMPALTNALQNINRISREGVSIREVGLTTLSLFSFMNPRLRNIDPRGADRPGGANRPGTTQQGTGNQFNDLLNSFLPAGSQINIAALTAQQVAQARVQESAEAYMRSLREQSLALRETAESSEVIRLRLLGLNPAMLGQIALLEREVVLRQRAMLALQQANQLRVSTATVGTQFQTQLIDLQRLQNLGRLDEGTLGRSLFQLLEQFESQTQSNVSQVGTLAEFGSQQAFSIIQNARRQQEIAGRTPQERLERLQRRLVELSEANNRLAAQMVTATQNIRQVAVANLVQVLR